MATPSEQYRYASIRTSGKIPTGADALVDALVGMFRRRPGVRAKLRREARKIDKLAPSVKDLSDAELKEQLERFRDDFRSRPDGPPARLYKALSALREAAVRTTGMRPYPVQLMGALALHRGYIAEMATGEGKTLVAGLAGVLAGWTRRPCHIITVNDYLARRDAEWLEPLYTFCRLTVGYVTGSMESEERRHGYAQDVTYTTGKEILADFLRDRLRIGYGQTPERCHIRNNLQKMQGRRSENELVMRGLHTAIVDEVDSILIDEAVTPLIISRASPNPSLRKASALAMSVADSLSEGEHYRINRRYKEVKLTDSGLEKIGEAGQQIGGMWRAQRRWSELVEQSLVAREFFKKGHQYVINDGKIVIVDEFTGRMMPQRTWRHGIHQAIEAREGMEITDPSETLSRLSFQRFFRLFPKLSGMTGTAKEARGELWRLYHLPVIAIPTNRPCIRRLRKDNIFSNHEQKMQAVVRVVREFHRTDAPVLVGTRSVMASEDLAERLRNEGLEFSLLNAVNHQEEAGIIAGAGETGRITIATNMAGRGTDIKLGEGVRNLRGLRVIATERHESGRIDRQLFGRCARQGDPGEAVAFLCVDDELLVRFLPVKGLRALIGFMLRTHLPGGRLLSSLAVRLSQRSAQRQAYKQRKGVLRMDTWLDDSLSFTPNSDNIK